MKKILAILLTLMLSLSLFACCKEGGGTEPSTEAPPSTEQAGAPSADTEGDNTEPSTEQTSAPSTDTEAAEPDTSEDTGTMQRGDEGKGPAALDAGLIRLTIPEGLGYTIGSYYISESDPLSGNVTIQIRNENGHIAAKLEATTLNMVSSQEEAVQNVISLRNLDSYKEGKASVEGDAQYGENTYTLVKISTENYEKDYFVAYVGGRSAADAQGLLISLEVDLGEIASDDPLIQDVLNSITVTKA